MLLGGLMADVFFRRYTELPALIHMLTHQQLTLLDPRSWDDKNDSYFLAQYREKRKLKSVLALCFTQADETYHHWRIFSAGSGGVCVTFKGVPLLSAVTGISNLQMGSVRYLKVKEIRKRKLKVKELPYLKRAPFEPEDEARMLWESATEQRSCLPVPIQLSSISRVTLSPWMHASLAKSVKDLLRSMPGCSSLQVVRSTLIGNDEWMKCGGAAT
jgi:hypothetical protein